MFYEKIVKQKLKQIMQKDQTTKDQFWDIPEDAQGSYARMIKPSVATPT